MRGKLHPAAVLTSAVAFFASFALALEVRTAAQDSQPKFIKEDNAVTSLCIDIFKAVERTDPDLKFQALSGFAPLPRAESQLAEGSLDDVKSFDDIRKLGPEAIVLTVTQTKLGDKIKLRPAQLSTEGRLFMVSKKAPAGLKDKLTAALDKMSKSGELTKIFQPYSPK